MPTRMPDSRDLMRDLRKRANLLESEAKRYRAALSVLGEKPDGSTPSASTKPPKRRSAAARKRMSDAQKARFERERQTA